MGRGLLDGGAQHLALVGDPRDELAVQAREDVGADHRPRPGAEILGGEAFAHRLLDVLVDVVPMDVHLFSIAVAELEYVPPWYLHQLAHDSCDAAIA